MCHKSNVVVHVETATLTMVKRQRDFILTGNSLSKYFLLIGLVSFNLTLLSFYFSLLLSSQRVSLLCDIVVLSDRLII